VRKSVSFQDDPLSSATAISNPKYEKKWAENFDGRSEKLEEDGGICSVLGSPVFQEDVAATITEDAEWNEILERGDISAKVKLCV